MNTLYYTTIDHSQIGRASHYYRGKASALVCRNAQNERARNLAIKAVYEVCQVTDEGIESKEIRD